MGCEDKSIKESENPRRKEAPNFSESKTLPSHAYLSYTPPLCCKLKDRIVLREERDVDAVAHSNKRFGRGF
eukprot:513090-Pelagomonas_calceolata.AAC.1